MPRASASAARSIVILSPSLISAVRPATRNPVGAREWHARHRGRLDRQGHQILRLQIMHMALAAPARDRLELQRQHREIIRQPPPRLDGIEPRGEFKVLRGDPGGIAPLVPIIICARMRAELHIFGLERGIVITERDQRGRADRHRVRAECERFGDIGPGANAARDDQLDSAMHAQVLERAHRRPHACERGQAHIFNKHFLRRCSAALHPVDHHDVRPRLHRERGVIIGTTAADLDVNRLLPICDFAQFLDLDRQIVGAGPIGVARGAALIDAFGQAPHFGDARADLLAEQHAAAAGLRALADDDLDRVGAAEIVRVHSVARRKILVDECRGMPTLLRRHPAIARGGGRSRRRRAAPQRLLCLPRKRTEAHPRNRDRRLEHDRRAGVTRAQHHIGPTALAVAFERVARNRCAQKQQIVKARQRALRARAADVVDARRGCTPDLADRIGIEGCRITRHGPVGMIGHQYAPALSTWKW